jgi:glucose/arabinose dehydrogenase/mono/diheme cytochrome c family protein
MRPLLAGLCLLAALTLPACSKAASPEQIAAGKAVFAANCALCHDASPAMGDFQGPPLFGVVGRKIGGVAGFDYSEALKAAHDRGETWNDSNLDAFLADPQQAMPGTQMPVNVPEATDRRNLIAYLTSLNGKAAARPAEPASGPMSGSDNLDWRKDAPGVLHRVTVADLPKPFATDSAGNSARYVAPSANFLPKAPAGFTVSLFSQDMDGPRNMRTAPNGDLYVVESGRGRISVFRNQGGTLSATRVTFAEKLNEPFGIAFQPGYVYVANAGSVVRIPIAGGKAETVVADLSTTGGHSTRDIAFSADGKYMYVSVGSASNVAEGIGKPPAGFVTGHALGESWGSEAGRALVLRFRPDGSDRHVFATGIRNCVGLAFKPGTNDLYCTTNERDMLGDNLVPDYFTRVAEGQFFGWPWYYLGDHEDPRQAGVRPDLRGKVSLPDTLFVSHSAPLGFTFYQTPAGAAQAFPAQYDGQAFIALHGSWNRSARTGSKVVIAHIKDGVPTGEYEDFLTGFILDDKRVSGRPVGVAVGPEGALYVSDDAGNRIWRVAPE